MAASTGITQIMPQSHTSSIQDLRNEGKVKDSYISEKLMARSNSTQSDSTSSIHSKSKQMSFGHEAEKSSSTEHSPMCASSKWSYGSIQGLNCSDRQSVASILDDDYTPPTPPHTTITPNENDEGIYLSWTQHMLRQQGFRPSSYNNDHGDSGSDSDSTNSSLTDDEEDSLPITPPHFPTSRSFPRQKSISNLKAKEEETKGWLTVPFCGFCFM